MVIFHSYVKLPEGRSWVISWSHVFLKKTWKVQQHSIVKPQRLMVIIWGSILNIKQIKTWISTNIVYYGWFMLILHPMIFHHIHHCPIFHWFNHSNHLLLRWTQVRSSHPIRCRGSKQSPSSPSKRGSLSACQSCAKVRLVLRRLRLAMKSVGWFLFEAPYSIHGNSQLGQKGTASNTVTGDIVNHVIIISSQDYNYNCQCLKPTRNAFQFISIKARIGYAFIFLNRLLVPSKHLQVKSCKVGLKVGIVQYTSIHKITS